MGPVVTIANRADDRVDEYRNLTDAELRRRQKQANGLFLAEGVLVIRQLLASQYPVRSFLVTRAKLDQLTPSMEAVESHAPVYLVDTETMAGITGFRFHRGALASVQRLPGRAAADMVRPPSSLVVVAEGVNDHENMGALFRNAAAFGLDAVLLSPTCADPLYRRSVRVSMGQVLRVPWAWLAPWPEALGLLKADGFTLVGLTPDPAVPSLEQVIAAMGAGIVNAGSVTTGTVTSGTVAAGTQSRPVAVLVGAEGPGLSDPARRTADALARIPLAAGVDSLNVATAAAIAFHQLAERRWAAQPGGSAPGR